MQVFAPQRNVWASAFIRLEKKKKSINDQIHSFRTFLNSVSDFSLVPSDLQSCVRSLDSLDLAFYQQQVSHTMGTLDAFCCQNGGQNY
jgi:hypothetical protein